MGEFGGGGLNRRVCQFVDCKFYTKAKKILQELLTTEYGSENTSKCSLLEESSWSIVSANTTSGSRMNKWDICFDSKSSIPSILFS